MKKIIKISIVLACFLLGIWLLLFSIALKYDIPLNYSQIRAFILGKDGRIFGSDVCYDLGIGLLSSLVFLICVDVLLDHTNAKEIKEHQFELKKKQVERRLMLDPKKCISELNEKGELHSGYFESQNLMGCQLSGQNLEGVSFIHTNFENARFIDANLTSCNFTSSILTNAEFNNATLSFAVFTDSNVSSDQLQTAYSLWRAILPNGKRYSGEYQLAGDIKLAEKNGYDLSDEIQKNKFYGN